MRGAPALDLRWTCMTRRRPDPPGCGDETTRPGTGEQVAPDHPDHGEHEDPQQDEEAEPGNSEHDRWHAAPIFGSAAAAARARSLDRSLPSQRTQSLSVREEGQRRGAEL